MHIVILESHLELCGQDIKINFYFRPAISKHCTNILMRTKTHITLGFYVNLESYTCKLGGFRFALLCASV